MVTVVPPSGRDRTTTAHPHQLGPLGHGQHPVAGTLQTSHWWNHTERPARLEAVIVSIDGLLAESLYPNKPEVRWIPCGSQVPSAAACPGA